MDHAVGATGGDGFGPSYANWDKDSTTMCVCDTGFTGADCSLRICPKGDDPLTPVGQYRSVVISTGATSGLLAGYFNFKFLGESIRFPANSSAWQAEKCVTDLQSLANVEKVSCVRDAANPDTLGANYTITFVSYPVLPYENNIFSHSGSASLNQMSCDVSEMTNTGAVNPHCSIFDVANSGIYEYAMCSNRGLCDVSTGLCSCYGGFTGINCATSTQSVATSFSSTDIILLYATNGDWQGNNIHLKTDRSASDAFNFIWNEANSVTQTKLKVRIGGVVNRQMTSNSTTSLLTRFLHPTPLTHASNTKHFPSLSSPG